MFLILSLQIHVDRYKYEVYTNISDPILRQLVTRDPTSTRFHACERFDRCDAVRPDDPSVIYINPKGLGYDNWNHYMAKMRVVFKKGERPSHLVCVLSS